jgi:hypothetical protein
VTRPQTQPLRSVPSTRNRQRLRSRDWPRPPRRDPHVRVIAQLMEMAGPNASVIGSSSRPWASATFLGAQHRVILRFGGDHAHSAATDFAERIGEAEFHIAGHIVADACVDGMDHEAAQPDAGSAPPPAEQGDRLLLRISVLTIEEW